MVIVALMVTIIAYLVLDWIEFSERQRGLE